MKKEGNNPYNNRVIVDYENKKITFVPIGKKSIRKYYFIFLVNIITLYCFLILIPIVLIVSLVPEMPLNMEGFIYLITIMQMIPMSIYFSLWFFRPKWRKQYYPELNYKIINNFMFRYLTGKKLKKEIIEPKAIHNKQLIIPHFSNVRLYYETTGDFSKYLKKVFICNIFKGDPWNWNCCFEFTKKPKKGTMKIDYR